ncbi:MAG: hypothetical protein V1865_00255 [bacterium]
MKKTIISILTTVLIFTSCFLAIPVSDAGAYNLKDAFKVGGPLDKTAEKVGYDTSQRTIDPIISTIITVVLSFLGVIFLLLMIYGGFLWMTGGGNEKQTVKAKQIIVAAMIGLIIVVAAYAITFFVIDQIAEGSGLIIK